MEEKFLVSLDSPRELELLYRENPDDFQKVFPNIFSQHPESVILKVWYERLNFSHSGTVLNGEKDGQQKSILLIVLLVVITGTILQAPVYFERIDPNWFYNRNLAGVIIGSLMAYFFFQKPHSRRMVLITLGAIAGVWLYLALLPYEYNGDYWGLRKNFRAFADAIGVAELHAPVFMWLTFGVVFAGKNWKSVADRMNFLKYNGEVIVYTSVTILSGGVLILVTMVLLSSVENTYELTSWYTKYVVPYVFVASPIVATYLIDMVIGKRFNFAPTLARIFAPLFLITTIAYLIVMAVYQQSPFVEREYLMAFNVLLIVVLGLLIFTIAERGAEVRSGVSDYINIGLVLTTLIIDLVVLAAVVSRMAGDENGLTPNRAAILGLNLLVFIHLVGIFYHYVRFAIKKDVFIRLEEWITGYLPIYAIWSVAISVVLPLVFWYR